MNRIKERFVWLSYPLDPSMPSYGNGEGFEREHIQNISKGDSCNTSRWHLVNHIGTHIDTPNHFFQIGSSIEDFPPEFWQFFKVSVVKEPAINENMCIEIDKSFKSVPKETDLLLIYTGYCKHRSEKKYWANNPGLSSKLAIFLRNHFPNLRAVGIDSISISSGQNRYEGRKAHKAFLDPDGYGKPILLIEDMDLTIIEDDVNILSSWVIPMRVTGADGAPCTIIAGVDKC